MLKVESPNDQESTIKFCNDCKSVLQISIINNCLAYICERETCKFEMVIHGQGQMENLVSKIGSTTQQNLVINKDFSQDPTMPREQIPCPVCNYPEAVFMITQDAEDTKIELIYLCANRQCGHSWKKQVED